MTNVLINLMAGVGRGEGQGNPFKMFTCIKVVMYALQISFSFVKCPPKELKKKVYWIFSKLFQVFEKQLLYPINYTFHNYGHSFTIHMGLSEIICQNKLVKYVHY